MKGIKHYKGTENSAMMPAGAVVIQPKTNANGIIQTHNKSLIQRKAAAHSPGDYDDEHVLLKPLSGHAAPFIQAKSDNPGKASNAVSGKIKDTKGGGNPMAGPIKSFMESRFGNDFSDVRIHTGDYAAQMSNELNAQAFTVGSDIYFNSGKYAPGASEGKHLLAHELTHTIQQGTSIKPKIQKQDKDDDKKLPLLTPPAQLQMPRLLPGYGKYQFGLGNYNFNLPNPGRLNLNGIKPPALRPLFQFLPPFNLTLTAAQLYNILGEYRLDYFAEIPALPESDNDGVRLGGDQFRDMFTGNHQISAVARGFDLANFTAKKTLFDFLHEPTLTFTSATPGSGTDNSVQLGLTILNAHLGRRLEFAPLQIGVDNGAGVAFGSQLEIHTANPKYSSFINFGLNIQPAPDGKYKVSSFGGSWSFYPHFLNP